MKLRFSVAALLLSRCKRSQDRPNILPAIADDWGWPHAGAYDDPVVKTPTFDRNAEGGVLFHQTYVSSPSGTPSLAAIVTRQYHWRLEESANLFAFSFGSSRRAPSEARARGAGRDVRHVPILRRHPASARRRAALTREWRFFSRGTLLWTFS